MFEKFQPKNYVCNQGQTTIQIQAPTNMEAKWSSDEKQLEEILKTKLRLELTSLTIYSHWLVKALTSNIFPHMLLTWSLLTKPTNTQPEQRRKSVLLYSKR